MNSTRHPAAPARRCRSLHAPSAAPCSGAGLGDGSPRRQPLGAPAEQLVEPPVGEMSRAEWPPGRAASSRRPAEGPRPAPQRPGGRARSLEPGPASPARRGAPVGRPEVDQHRAREAGDSSQSARARGRTRSGIEREQGRTGPSSPMSAVASAMARSGPRIRRPRGAAARRRPDDLDLRAGLEVAGRSARIEEEPGRGPSGPAHR